MNLTLASLPKTPLAHYRGRFAPTPSGELHFGSLVAALGSWLQARARGGSWLVRIDDIDTKRIVPGATAKILRTLEAFGLEWDEAPRYQSERGAVYREVLAQLGRSGCLYRCDCSRKRLAATARLGVEGYIYPGTCRSRLGALSVLEARQLRGAIRIRTSNVPNVWQDELYGEQTLRLEEEIGDFVVWRADGVCSYHLANVVDDALDGITEVVRGNDLLPSTHRQAYLIDHLGYQRPAWFHLPVAVNAQGQKLSKQVRAPILDGGLSPVERVRFLCRALAFLDHPAGAELERATTAEVLAGAVTCWNLARLQPVRRKQVP